MGTGVAWRGCKNWRSLSCTGSGLEDECYATGSGSGFGFARGAGPGSESRDDNDFLMVFKGRAAKSV